MPPLAFGVLSALEGNVITPLLLGRSLSLNPVIVFVSLLLWGWLWGPAGLLLAVPLLVIAKILCDHIEPLAAVGESFRSLQPGSDVSRPAPSPQTADMPEWDLARGSLPAHYNPNPNHDTGRGGNQKK